MFYGSLYNAKLKGSAHVLLGEGSGENLDMFLRTKGNFIMIKELRYGQTWKIWPSPLSVSLYSTFKECLVNKGRFVFKSQLLQKVHVISKIIAYFIYVYICMYIYVHVYLYVHMYVYVHIYVYICTYVCICIYIYLHIYKYICIGTQAKCT